MKIEQQITETVNAAIDQANRVLSRNFSYPRCDFTLKGTVAGLAFSGLNTLSFNIGIAADNLEHFLKQTVPHEVAHIVADKYYGRNCGHKQEWKRIMTFVYGLEPLRCHNYDVKKHVIRRTFVYRYKCGCSDGVVVGPKYHKILQARPVAVSCQVCGFKISHENFIGRRLKY